MDGRRDGALARAHGRFATSGRPEDFRTRRGLTVRAPRAGSARQTREGPASRALMSSNAVRSSYAATGTRSP